MPPVMAFHLGSLGFLTPFSFENFQAQVTQVIQGESRPWAGPAIPCGSECPTESRVTPACSAVREFLCFGGTDTLPLWVARVGPGQEPPRSLSALVDLPADTRVMPSFWQKKRGCLVGRFSVSCGVSPHPC